MSRRYLFLVVTTAVMLYFSVILLMLLPLHEKGYVGGGIALRQVPNVKWCKELRYRNPPSAHVTGLVSFPGSGNTWLRYLLQQVTGIMTGSVYMDHGLRLHGFPAENVSDGSVLVVKTHEMSDVNCNFQSIILLMRHPKDAILADFNRLHKGHIGTAPLSAFKMKTPDNKMLTWPLYAMRQLRLWELLHRKWMYRFPAGALVVAYEDLVRDTRGTLAEILHFLRHNYTEADMGCALANREGIYRRRHKHADFEPYSGDMLRAMERVRGDVTQFIQHFMGRVNDTTDNK